MDRKKEWRYDFITMVKKKKCAKCPTTSYGHRLEVVNDKFFPSLSLSFSVAVDIHCKALWMLSYAEAIDSGAFCYVCVTSVCSLSHVWMPISNHWIIYA